MLQERVGQHAVCRKVRQPVCERVSPYARESVRLLQERVGPRAGECVSPFATESVRLLQERIGPSAARERASHVTWVEVPALRLNFGDLNLGRVDELEQDGLQLKELRNISGKMA